MNLLETLIVIFVMLIFNAVFAAYEMALAAVSPARLAGLADKKAAGSGAALFMKSRMEASLAVIQLGITLVGAIAAAMGGAGADEAFAPFLQDTLGLSPHWSDIIALALIIIPLSAFTIIFGELVPKTFALNNKEWVCLKLSPFMRGLYGVFYPVVWLFESIVRRIAMTGGGRAGAGSEMEAGHIHELRTAASLARTSLLIGARQEKIVHSATELSVRTAREILIPASEISMIPASLSLAQALVRAHHDMHTRFPVCEREGDPQSITGYVNFKDIIFALHANPVDPTLKGVTRPIRSVDAQAKNSAVLEEMIQSGAHIALVREAGGRIIGLVTLEDILEELVGEIQDEYDRLPSYVHPYLSGWLMGGGVAMNIVSSAVGAKTPVAEDESGRVPTLAEWCERMKGRRLVAGDVIAHPALRVTVRKLRRKQLSEALVQSASTSVDTGALSS